MGKVSNTRCEQLPLSCITLVEICPRLSGWRGLFLQNVIMSAKIFAYVLYDHMPFQTYVRLLTLQPCSRHVKAGFHCLIGAVTQQKSPDSTTSSICQCYILSAACGNFGSRRELDIVRYGIVDNDYSYIEKCQGLPRSVMDSMVEINLLAASPTPASPTQIEDIRLELARATPNLEDPGRHHLANVFWYAASICYNKWLVRSTDTQHLAIKAFEHLQLATHFTPEIGRVSKWALYTFGVELTTNELRNRMFLWCKAHCGTLEFEGIMELLRSTWSMSDRPDVQDPVHACWRLFKDPEELI